MKKVSYTDRNSQKIHEVIREHDGMTGIYSQFGSYADDCNATIFFRCNDGHQGTMSVKSMRSANMIVDKVKKFSEI
jgi:hypothetical protein